MKVLTLSIKREWFNKILSGEKTHEYREVNPRSGSKYIYYRNNGKAYEMKDLGLIPDDDSPIELAVKEYDAIKFLTGAYSGKRPWMIVEIKKAGCIVLTDEEGKDVEYEWNGLTYLAKQMDYTLGKIIDKNLNP